MQLFSSPKLCHSYQPLYGQIVSAYYSVYTVSVGDTIPFGIAETKYPVHYYTLDPQEDFV